MAVIATAGHVDHGKSTLVRALTGIDPDRLPEEKRRGLTMDLGFAWSNLDGVRVSFVDVPGHRRYVGTMLAGVGPLAAVLLAVAADDGWAAQTEEHVEALCALGLQRIVVAVTRADLADPGPAVVETVKRLAAKGIPASACVPTAALEGRGLCALRDALRDLALSLPAPDSTAPVRLWVDRSFTIRGAGTVVTGTLTNGTIRTGDLLVIGSREVRVRAIQSAGENLELVRGTTRIALNLRGVSASEIHRGNLVSSRGLGTLASVADAVLLRALPRLPRHVTVHVGTASAPVRVRVLPGGRARLTTVDPTGLPWAIGDRVVLRDPGVHRVLTGGVIESLDAPRPRRRAPSAPQRPTPPLCPANGALTELVALLADNPLAAPHADWAVSNAVSAHELAEAERSGQLLRVGGVIVGPQAVETAVRQLTRIQSGFSPSEAAETLGASRRVTLALLGRLDALGHTRRHPDGTRNFRRADN